MFRKLKTRSAKKKFLGAILIVAFVAFLSFVLTRYIMTSEVDLIKVTVISVVLIIALLTVIGARKKKRAKKPKKKKR